MKRAAFTLTVLGSGTGVPSLERCGPAYLLQRGRHSALIDCGNGALRQLLKTGCSHLDLDAVFISHAHADHISDLVTLLYARLLHDGDLRPLDLYGPAGFHEPYTGLILPLVAPKRQIEVHLIEAPDHFRWADCLVSTAATRHSDRLASIAYRFEADGRSVVLSGDADDDDGLRFLATGADLLVLDCSYPDAAKVEGHLSASQCGRLAAGAGAAKVLLSHLYPTDCPATVRLDECKLYYAGPVVLAEDLMELTL